ncbi:MAG: AgmX/PglI C-terminal domain-containing protein [Myxococcota bacterium]
MRSIRGGCLIALGLGLFPLVAQALPEATVRASADRLCALYTEAATKHPGDIAEQEAWIGQRLGEVLRMNPAVRAKDWHPDLLARFAEVAKGPPLSRASELGRYVGEQSGSAWSCPAMAAYDKAMAAALDKKRGRWVLKEREKAWVASSLSCRGADKPSGRGSNDAIEQTVEPAIKAKQAEIQACHERWLPPASMGEQGLDLGGSLEVTVIFAPTGRPREARVETSTLKSVEVESCVLSELCRLELPSFAGEPVELAVPFVFAPKR